MKEIKLYQCEICGAEYRNKEEAAACEVNHAKTLEVVDCKFTRKTWMKDGFPTEITVKSENGRERKYGRLETIQNADSEYSG